MQLGTVEPFPTADKAKHVSLNFDRTKSARGAAAVSCSAFAADTGCLSARSPPSASPSCWAWSVRCTQPDAHHTTAQAGILPPLPHRQFQQSAVNKTEKRAAAKSGGSS